MPPVTPALIRELYPEFAGLSDAVIDFWIGKAAVVVTSAWGEDEQEGLLLLTAHKLKTSGALAMQAGAIPAGVTRFRSSSMDVAVTEAAANQSLSSEYGSTTYGQAFRLLLRRNVGGPRLIGCSW